MSLSSIDIDQSSLSRSLQVINSVNCVIRELVENSIDANSTRIDVKLVNGGIELIQVSDNGSGITESNFEMLATKHATSKITKFEDLFSSLNTFGFRGEALYSLCNLSTLEVETRVPSCDHGWLLNYDCLGNLTSKLPIASNIGTCVRVKELFKNYTVRQKVLAKSIKNQVSKAVSQLQQYALINPGISFNLTTVSTDNQYSNIFTTSGNHTTLRGVVEQIFGQDFSSKLVDVFLTDTNWKIEGLISSPYIETGYRDLEYFYINKRPIGKTYKFRYAILSVFSQFSSKSKPSFILNLTIDSDKVDVNLSPDKRSAFLFSEDYIIRTFKENLYEILMPKPSNISEMKSELLSQYLSQHEVEYTILPYLSSSNTQSHTSHTSDNLQTPKTDDQQNPYDYGQNTSKESYRQTPKDENITLSLKIDNLQTPKMDYKDTTRCELVIQTSKESYRQTPKETNIIYSINSDGKSSFDKDEEEQKINISVKRELEREEDEPGKKLVIESVNNTDTINKSSTTTLESTISESSTSISQSRSTTILEPESEFESNSKSNLTTTTISEPGSTTNQTVSEPITVDFVKPARYVSLEEFLDTSTEESGSGECVVLEIDEETLYSNEDPVMMLAKSQEQCSDCELNKEKLDEHNLIDPQVFQNMKLVGQFNNGFIITKLNFPDVKSNFNYSLYIIDQHAADEKAKFENLNKRVKIYKQNLINPKLIEISPFLTQVAEQHLDLLISNGFDTTICKGSEEVMYNDPEMSMSRESNETMIKGVYIHSFPQVLGKVLDEEDFVDFVNQLSYSEQTDGNYEEEFIWGGGSIPRPQKVWTILATKACKTAVKVGDPLSNGQMKNIIGNMANLVHPWNCPHGRPSIKCLISHHELDKIFHKNK